jgi:hypothetical protein
MKRKHLFSALAAALIVLGNGAAKAGEAINEAGAVTCATDKWNETEPEKGHKLVDYAGRCVCVDNNAAVPSRPHDCVGKYEFMPDGSWKGGGTCTSAYKDGNTLKMTFEEGSHLKASVYKITGGTGKYQGASGGGTYVCDSLSDTLCGGRFDGKVELQ